MNRDIDEDRVTVCAGHEELRTVVIETRKDVQHLSETLEKFMTKIDQTNAGMDARVRDLELHGAEISRQNAKDLESIDDRVNNLEEFRDITEAAKGEAKKIAIIIASVISAIGTIVSIAAVVFLKIKGG